jgi:hypothetical protein
LVGCHCILYFDHEAKTKHQCMGKHAFGKEMQPGGKITYDREKILNKV